MRLALWVRAVGFSQLWDIHHREEGVSGNQIQVIFNSIALISRSKVLIHHFIIFNVAPFYHNISTLLSTNTDTTTTNDPDKPLSETGGLNIPEQRLSFREKRRRC